MSSSSDRTHVKLGGALKKAASEYADSVGMDLSELVRQLLREELNSPTIWPQSKKHGGKLSLISHVATATSSAQKRKSKRASCG